MIRDQFLYFFTAFCYGAGTLFIYDFMRIWRKIRKTKKSVECIQDIVFWTVAAIVTFPMVLAKNSGTLRSFFFAAFLVGMLCYSTLIGQHFVNVGEKLLRIIFRPVFKIVKKVLKIVYEKIIMKIYSKLRR